MEAQPIDSVAAFDTLREEWNGLLRRSSADNVFLTWEWLRTWWDHLAEGRKLAISALREDGRLVGLAPLGIRRADIKRLIPFRCGDFLGSGTVGSDYLDLIVQRGSEEEAFEAWSSSLGRAKRMLEFGQLKPGAQAARFAHSLERQGWRSATSNAGTCPFIDLRGHTWSTYLASLSSDHRYNVRRKTKSLAKNFEVTFDRVETQEQLGPALRLLIDLHQKRWLEHGDSDAFHTPGHIAFHHEFTRLALDRGWLRLYVLNLNGQPASAIYALRYGPSFCFYQSGFDPEFSRHSVGLVAMALSVERAIEEGAEEYDFLHGTEAYKFHWANGSRDLERIQLYPPGPGGWCRQAVLGGRSRAKGWFRPAIA